MIRWPDEIQGGGRLGSWLNKLRRAAMANSLQSGTGIDVSGGSHGKTVSVIGSRSGGSRIFPVRLESDPQNDFYSCKEWNGTETVGDEIYVARPFEHMVSNYDGQSIAYNSDGDSFTAVYDYTSPTKRTVTIAGTAEVQILTPLFKSGFTILWVTEVDTEITAGPVGSREPVTDPDDNPVTLIDLNIEGRAWTKN